MKIIRPVRATRTYTQHLDAVPEVVFPLLCPVLEAEWIDGWDPTLVVTESGIAERDCVFTTAAEAAEAIWYITRHEADTGFVEMIKITPEVTACRLTIQLRGADNGCEADVCYSPTSLGPRGDLLVASFTEAFYSGFMKDWENRLNQYLRESTSR